MKRIITLLALIVISTINAQAPQGFNYQATVRNSAGALITNQNVLLKFNIMLNSQTSLPVYSETHQAPTDDLGQVNLVIGTGTPSTGTFSTINWANGTYYLGIELNTGSGYVVMGTTQLLSVPYAMYANTAGSANSNSFNHYIGELYGGGIVVSVWKTNGIEHGLIASLTDLSSAIPWVPISYQGDVPEQGAPNYRDGLANTNYIVSIIGPGNNYAAGICKAYNGGGFTDWYLPASWELNQCYNSALIVNEVLGDSNGFKAFYWSSNFSGSQAWLQDFQVGETTTIGFINGGRVRAVRRF